MSNVSIRVRETPPTSLTCVNVLRPAAGKFKMLGSLLMLIKTIYTFSKVLYKFFKYLGSNSNHKDPTPLTDLRGIINVSLNTAAAGSENYKLE